MPLSEPQPRELLHLRDIALRGFQRADGMFDVEAHMTDTKTYGFPSEDRGQIEAGEPLHGMWARMTVDEDLLIQGFEVAMDHTPYAVCPGAAPNFARLAGLTIGRGFLKEAARRVGGTEGCTHIRELLQQMATVAYQTLYPVRLRKRNAAAQDGPQPAPALLNTCHAWSSDSPVIARGWPHLYTGPERDGRAEAGASASMDQAADE
jgi:Protein of unknown function (DUF2889)